MLYVDAAATGLATGESWTNAITDLQVALSASDCLAGTVSEIWVAQGTYRPDRGTADRDVSFQLRNGLAIYGGFAGNETQRDQRNPQANRSLP